MNNQEAKKLIENMSLFKSEAGKSVHSALCDALMMACHALEEQDKRKWISVEDDLPESLDVLPDFSVRVLITSYIGVTSAQYVFSEGVWVDNALNIVTGTCQVYDESMHVTAWMPLPEPYEDEADEEDAE